MRGNWSRVRKLAMPAIGMEPPRAWGRAPTPTASRTANPGAQAIKETAQDRPSSAAHSELVFRNTTSPKGKHRDGHPLVLRAGVQVTVGGGVCRQCVPADVSPYSFSSRYVTRD